MGDAVGDTVGDTVGDNVGEGEGSNSTARDNNDIVELKKKWSTIVVGIVPFRDRHRSGEPNSSEELSGAANEVCSGEWK